VRRGLLLLAGILAAGPACAQSVPTAASFLDAQSVNIHWTYNGTAYELRDLPGMMRYIGFAHARGENAIGASPTQLARYKALAASGVKWSITYFWQSRSIDDDIEAAENLQRIAPGSLEAIEGQNECDGNPADYRFAGHVGFDGCVAYQKALYTAVKADRKLAGLLVYNASLTMGSSKTFPDMTGVSDRATGHVYFATLPAIVGLRNQLPKIAASADHPVVMTESGYADGAEPSFPYWVSQTAEASYQLEASLDAFAMRVNGAPVRLYKYELVDEHADNPPTDHEFHFGLFNYDGSPKPVATAYHNLAAILSDPTPGANPAPPPAFSLGALPQDGNRMLLAKSHAYDLVVWPNVSVYDFTVTPRRDIVVRPQPVRLDLGAAYPEVRVFDPVHGVAPIATYANQRVISLPLAGSPLVVEIGTASAS
jgi:hypothetical protein